MNARLNTLRRQCVLSTHFRERCHTNLEQISDILQMEPDAAQLRAEWSRDDELTYLILHLRPTGPAGTSGADSSLK